jgi:hypothetical protein
MLVPGRSCDLQMVCWGVVVAADFSMLGLALVLEACSGARGVLKERKH